MTLDRVPMTESVIDVLDHVIDKGIVIDAWARVAPAGIDLRGIDGRLVVASTGLSSVPRVEPVAAAGRRPAARRGVTR
jgi:hypothetical protein